MVPPADTNKIREWTRFYIEHGKSYELAIKLAKEKAREHQKVLVTVKGK